MKKLLLKRIKLEETYTVGELYMVDGNKQVFLCHTLEDKVRDINKNGVFDNGEKKVYGQTAIPYGKYELVMEWSPKFQRILPLLLNVDSFKYIRIHAGNSVADTDGCILVGEYYGGDKIVNSKATLDRLLRLLNEQGKWQIEIV